MTLFETALDTIFADPNFGADAAYQAPGGAVKIACRLVFTDPDAVFSAPGFGVQVPARMADLRVAEIATIEENGILTIAGTDYRIVNPSNPDSRRLVWRCGLTPVNRVRS